MARTWESSEHGATAGAARGDDAYHPRRVRAIRAIEVCICAVKIVISRDDDEVARSHLRDRPGYASVARRDAHGGPRREASAAPHELGRERTRRRGRGAVDDAGDGHALRGLWHK